MDRARLDAAKRKCRSEWESVNDPPCHPSDADWRPCPICDEHGDASGGERPQTNGVGNEGHRAPGDALSPGRHNQNPQYREAVA